MTQQNEGNHFVPPAPSATPSSLNLTDLANSHHKYTLQVEPETPEERASRLRREEADAAMKRTITTWLFFFSLLLVGAVFAVAGYTVVTGTQDDKKWAVPLITLIASGLVGFLVGKATATGK